ncbi:MAG TPA: YcaO-like family protein, partial [Polyangiales bacterium]|nr:YcaO-like family protein [Polyangiales bacterium]
MTASDDTTAQRRLSELQAQYGLPEGCELRETFFQRTTVSQLELCMVGLVADAGGGTTVTGAAADEHGFPVDRAYFELVERLSVFLARRSSQPLVVRDCRGARKAERPVTRVFPVDPRPEQLRTSLSNGVALHASWPAACEAALCELIERDRVLRSFAGEFAPLQLPAVDPTLARNLAAEYAVEAYTFGPSRRKLLHLVAGLFLLPKRPL